MIPLLFSESSRGFPSHRVKPKCKVQSRPHASGCLSALTCCMSAQNCHAGPLPAATLAFFSAPWTLPGISLPGALFPQITECLTSSLLLAVNPSMSLQWGLASLKSPPPPLSCLIFFSSLSNVLYIPSIYLIYTLFPPLEYKLHKAKGTWVHCCIPKVCSRTWPGYEFIRYLLNEWIR